MPELTPELAAAFDKLRNAAHRAMDILPEGERQVALSIALAACEPKVPTLLEAAEALVGRTGDDIGLVSFDNIDALRAAIARERAAQAALDWTLADGTGSSDPIEPKPPAPEAVGAVRAAAEISEATGRDLTPCVATTPATEAVKDYREPWYVRSIGSATTRDHQDAVDLGYGLRTVNCVNALAGCNPGRLGGLLDALNHYSQTSTQSSWRMVREALAAFKPETT